MALKLKQLVVRVPDELKSALARRSAEIGESESVIVREALKQYLGEGEAIGGGHSARVAEDPFSHARVARPQRKVTYPKKSSKASSG